MKHYNPALHGSPRAFVEQSKKFKGGGGGSSTSQTGIDPILKPYITYGLNEAQNLYKTQTPEYYQGQTYVSPSSATTQALNEAQARATAGSPLLSGAQTQQADVLSGKYLAPNPYLTSALGGASQAAQQNYFDAISKAQSDASRAGRYGSSASADIQNRAATTCLLYTSPSPRD